MAREHMGAHTAPQLQKETSEGAGASTTAGGACEQGRVALAVNCCSAVVINLPV